MQAVVEQAASRESLISDNLGLVHSCANRFRGRGVEYDDLFQAGCVGLIKAADGFDPSRGFAFSTYAVPVILGEIRRIFRDGGTVKVGRAMKEKRRVTPCGKRSGLPPSAGRSRPLESSRNIWEWKLRKQRRCSPPPCRPYP